MSIQEDAVWPPAKVDEADLDQTELAQQQRDLVEDPTKAPTAGLAGNESGGGDEEGGEG